MANPDQKTILIEQAYEEIKEICTKFQEDSGASDMEVKTLKCFGFSWLMKQLKKIPSLQHYFPQIIFYD